MDTEEFIKCYQLSIKHNTTPLNTLPVEIAKIIAAYIHCKTLHNIQSYAKRVQTQPPTLTSKLEFIIPENFELMLKLTDKLVNVSMQCPDFALYDTLLLNQKNLIDKIKFNVYFPEEMKHSRCYCCLRIATVVVKYQKKYRQDIRLICYCGHTNYKDHYFSPVYSYFYLRRKVTKN